jgi:hypothetical protein
MKLIHFVLRNAHERFPALYCNIFEDFEKLQLYVIGMWFETPEHEHLGKYF